MSLHNFYIMNNQTEIKITGTPSGFITCGLPQGGAAMNEITKVLFMAGGLCISAELPKEQAEKLIMFVSEFVVQARKEAQP